jgi:phenylalanyl-tRNA synthetase beta chain
MKVPLSWLKDFIDITLPLEDLAARLTMVGLEVEEIHLVGLNIPEAEKHEFKITGLPWARDKFVVAQIDEVLPHPNADRLVLCRLNDGVQELIVLTGAPNLFEYKGIGPLAVPVKVAYAREGARLYDGHQPGEVLTTLKRTKIRGVESFSMVCSEKELGLSDEHEGIILLEPDAPTGLPLEDYFGDAVLEISILPNMIRNACILGVAREIAAFTGQPLRTPTTKFTTSSAAMPAVSLDIRKPELNPRFVLGMIENTQPVASPAWVQRRLNLAGMRPINSIVDATNYVMLEIGQPLHAFDYDVLLARAGGQLPTILTRTAHEGEHLTTLDGIDRALEPFTMLVCDTSGALSIAGVMGGAESEVNANTHNVLIEGASWNYINVRKTTSYLNLDSEAGYRFSRGIHPELAPWGVQLCLKRMFEWGGGQIDQGLIDQYPAPFEQVHVSISEQDVIDHLGITLNAVEIARLLESLEFKCRIEEQTVYAVVPPHRMDIGEGLVGKADLLEEIVRLYGFDTIPSLPLADRLPRQHNNRSLEGEERVRDLLVSLGFQEVITHRLSSIERETRRFPPGIEIEPEPYLRLLNPIAIERSVMRRSLLASILEVLEKNHRLSTRLAFFEIGPVFLPRQGQILPDEPRRLVIALTGQSQLPAWDRSKSTGLDFFDLKGVLEILLENLHIPEITFEASTNPSFHPGIYAKVRSGDNDLGGFGELHPLIKERYDLGTDPVIAADLDLEVLLASSPSLFSTEPVPVFPGINEDIALIVDEALPNGKLEAVIREAGGKLLKNVRLFDIYRGEQIGLGKKSLAYNLTYQAADRTLTDTEAAQVRNRIIRRLERDFEARLRSL